MVAANARTAITFSLSPGQAHDAPAGRALLTELGPLPESVHLVMDRAYEDGETRQLVLDLGMIPVVPPKSNRIEPWEYDRALYKKRNEIERLFRRLKGFRRIFSRFEKLDVLFLGFLYFALIVEALRLVGTRPRNLEFQPNRFFFTSSCPFFSVQWELYPYMGNYNRGGRVYLTASSSGRGIRRNSTSPLFLRATSSTWLVRSPLSSRSSRIRSKRRR